MLTRAGGNIGLKAEGIEGLSLNLIAFSLQAVVIPSVT